MRRHREEKTVVCKSRRGASESINPANTLILSFQPLKLGESKFLLFNHPVCGVCYDRSRKQIQRTKPKFMAQLWTSDLNPENILRTDITFVLKHQLYGFTFCLYLADSKCLSPAFSPKSTVITTYTSDLY